METAKENEAHFVVWRVVNELVAQFKGAKVLASVSGHPKCTTEGRN
jgi:hypothetical protein